MYRLRRPPSLLPLLTAAVLFNAKIAKGRKVRQDDQIMAFGRALAWLGLATDQPQREAHRVILRERRAS
jgi:hypothetical protein